jgi:hypothetical protein
VDKNLSLQLLSDDLKCVVERIENSKLQIQVSMDQKFRNIV